MFLPRSALCLSISDTGKLLHPVPRPRFILDNPSHISLVPKLRDGLCPLHSCSGTRGRDWNHKLPQGATFRGPVPPGPATDCLGTLSAHMPLVGHTCSMPFQLWPGSVRGSSTKTSGSGQREVGLTSQPVGAMPLETGKRGGRLPAVTPHGAPFLGPAAPRGADALEGRLSGRGPGTDQAEELLWRLPDVPPRKGPQDARESR